MSPERVVANALALHQQIATDLAAARRTAVDELLERQYKKARPTPSRGRL
jgi:hypothetical protein